MENRNFLCMDADGTIILIPQNLFQNMWSILVKSEKDKIRSKAIPYQNSLQLTQTVKKYLKGELENE